VDDDLAVPVEADDDVELMTAAGDEVSVETQLSTYLQLQMQMFRSVVASTSRHVDDDAHVHDLVDRFGTLQDRQMKIIGAIQQSRYSTEQVGSHRSRGMPLVSS